MAECDVTTTDNSLGFGASDDDGDAPEGSSKTIAELEELVAKTFDAPWSLCADQVRALKAHIGGGKAVDAERFWNVRKYLPKYARSQTLNRKRKRASTDRGSLTTSFGFTATKRSRSNSIESCGGVSPKILQPAVFTFNEDF